MISFTSNQMQLRLVRFASLVVLSGLLVFLGYAIWRVALEMAKGDSKELDKAYLLVLGVFTVISFVYAIAISYQVERLAKTQRWLINAVNWNVQRLKAHGLSQLPDEMAERQGDTTKAPARFWPWGAHHTDLLGHLEAAARQFWQLYDPDDPSTAPTNDMVADWLQSERGVSKEKARAIASILRADGLPTGPRR